MQTTDPLERLLRQSPLSNSMRAHLWDVYQATKDEDELTSALQLVAVPKEVKARLWDLKQGRDVAPIAPSAPTGRPSPMDLNVGIGPGAVPIGVDPRPGAAMATLGAGAIAAPAAAGLAVPAARALVPAAKFASSPVGAGTIAAVANLAGGQGPIGALNAGLEAALLSKRGSQPKGAAGLAVKTARAVTSRAAGAAVAAGLKAAPKAAAGVASKTPSRGAQVAAQHNALMKFAKGIAQGNPKVGEKIWLLLDDTGMPTKVLTPDQAGAAARKGLQTTWVKNLWN